MSIQKEPIFENVLGKEFQTFTQISKFFLLATDEMETIKKTIDATPQDYTETKKMMVFCDRILKVRQDFKNFIKTKNLVITKLDDEFYISGEDLKKYEKEYGEEVASNFTPKKLFRLKYGDKVSDDLLKEMDVHMSIPAEEFFDKKDSMKEE